MNAKKLISAAALLSAFTASAFAADVVALEGPNAFAVATPDTHATRAEIRAQAAEAQAKGLIGTGESFQVQKAESSAPVRGNVNPTPVSAGSGFAYVLG